jgi:hypothetical protein
MTQSSTTGGGGGLRGLVSSIGPMKRNGLVQPSNGSVEAQPPVAADDPNAIYQGGAFTAQGPFGD